MNTLDQIIQERNNRLASVGINAAYFTGYFAREVAKNGCQIYVSCYNEPHIDEVKPKLKKFLEEQE